MENYERYIPREYLALKINYCRKQLAELPEIRVSEHTVGGSKLIRVFVNSHRYDIGSEKGDKYYKIWQLRDELERHLQVYEAIWDSRFKGSVPLLKPEKLKRVLYTGNNTSIVMDKNYFYSLRNDANTDHPKPTHYYFNGTYYRSAAEREIAVFYSDMEIPFKYEPAVMLAGLRRPVYPDFVPYFKEIDNCKFHEHFGLMSSSDYLRDIKIKFGNYANSGLLAGLDYLFTYNSPDAPFDIRYFNSILNSALLGSVVCNRLDS